MCDRNRLEAFLRKAIRAGYYDENDLTFSELCERNDKKLFLKVTANDEHILHQLLPEVGDRSYNLRDRKTKFKLPSKNNYKAECDFITRICYSLQNPFLIIFTAYMYITFSAAVSKFEFTIFVL